MRMLALSGMLLALIGCSAPTMSTTVRLGAALGPPPESLAALAARARADGGIVFVGHATGTPVQVESGYAPAPYGLQVEFPRAQATVVVDDALGASMDPEVVLEGAAGPIALVNADGTPTTSYTVEQDDPDEWRRREIPANGSVLFFVMPVESDLFVVWRAAVEDGIASGEGTASETDVAVTDLAID